MSPVSGTTSFSMGREHGDVGHRHALDGFEVGQRLVRDARHHLAGHAERTVILVDDHE